MSCRHVVRGWGARRHQKRFGHGKRGESGHANSCRSHMKTRNGVHIAFWRHGRHRTCLGRREDTSPTLHFREVQMPVGRINVCFFSIPSILNAKSAPFRICLMHHPGSCTRVSPHFPPAVLAFDNSHDLFSGVSKQQLPYQQKATSRVCFDRRALKKKRSKYSNKFSYKPLWLHAST